MKFSVANVGFEKIKGDVAIVACWQKKKDKEDKGEFYLDKKGIGFLLDQKMDGLLSKTLKEEEFRGEANSTKLFHTFGKLPFKALLVVGLGEQKDFSLEVLRKAGAEIAAEVNDVKGRSVIIWMPNIPINSLPPQKRAQAIVEGILLGAYKFEHYKDKKELEKDTLEEVVFSIPAGRDKIKEGLERAQVVCDGVTLARDMVNLPAKDMTPAIFAKKAEELAEKFGLKITVWGKKEIEAQKMGLLLAVARGSENEPKFVQLSYKPAKSSKTIALVGKGVTFDSGGYDLKPGRFMLNMKQDMAGAAAMLATVIIAKRLKLSVALDVYLPLTDNMIDAKAEVTGNVIRSRSGKTVEIISTDAEGRLILADALNVALEKKPDYIIDAATLTGGVLYALGNIYTAVIGNDQKFINKYLASAKSVYEPAWQLPLTKEYKKALKEGIADLKNEGKVRADTINGALFLEEFVGETKWIHLDIAESAWSEEDKGYIKQGGTGAPIRTLVNLLAEF